MAVEGSSVAVQVGTAVKFPLASNCGRRFVYSVKFWWLWFFFLQQGAIPVPACVPTAGAPRRLTRCVFSALSWQQVAGCARESVPLCLFSPFQPKWNLAESLWMPCTLFSQSYFCFLWLPCNGFVCQILNAYFLLFPCRHMFQRAFSFLSLNFGYLTFGGKKASRSFCGADGGEPLERQQVVQKWVCPLYAVQCTR